MLSPHQIELEKRLEDVRHPIDHRYFSAMESEHHLRFDYRLRMDVATQRICMQVLQEEGVLDLFD